MTYGDYIKEKNKYGKMIKVLIVAVFAYLASSFLVETILLGILMLCIWMIPGMVIYSVLKESYDKKKLKDSTMNFPSDMEIKLIKRKNVKGYRTMNNEIYVIPLAFVFLILLIEISSTFQEKIMHLSVTVIILLSFYLLLRKLNKYQLILLDHAFIVHQTIATYDDIKKYQKIKLRSDNYIIELQVLDTYKSIVLCSEDMQVFEKALESHKSLLTNHVI